MSRQITLILLVIIFLLAACGAEPAPSVVESAPAQPTSEPEAAQETVAPDDNPEPEPVVSDCLNGEVSAIGQSIADDFETVSYEQVITWFCDGAEYEDILVALETESLTGIYAEEMLQMLADGLSWEDIWLLVGLTN
jgi:hypothetical protein